MNLNATNQLKAGYVLFEEGERTNCIYMLLKGRAEIYNRGIFVPCTAGTMLGIEQLTHEECPYSCRISEDSTVYAVPADSEEGLWGLLNANRDYNGIAVYNHARLLSEISNRFRKLNDCTERIYSDLKNNYDQYIYIAKRNNCKPGLIPEISQLRPFTAEREPDLRKLEYYGEYAKIPYDAVKAFYAPSQFLAIDTMREMAATEKTMMEACAEVSDYLADIFMLMSGSDDYSLYRYLLALATDLKQKEIHSDEIDSFIDNCMEYIGEAEALIGPGTSRPWIVDTAQLKCMYNAYRSGDDFRALAAETGNTAETAIAAAVKSLDHSFEQIVRFGAYPEDKTKEFAGLLRTFADLPDRESTDDEARKLRKQLTEHFYALYMLVFRSAAQTDRVPKAVELMLDYGYISEKLLREDQLAELVSLHPINVQEPCAVYTMREWLMAVYCGEKEPSRNELGQDYAEYLRELKKTGAITEEQEKEIFNNIDCRLEYEINNVMMHATRVVNGQLLVCLPILHEEQFIGDINKAYVTAAKINEMVRILTSKDFSIFYRETLFVDEDSGIDREWEMKNVYPMFVLYPTVGDNVIVWQEITGRKRDTQGRFFAPAFTYRSVESMMIKAFGQFRWSLCKTIQGVNWNNFQVHSLTSEYSDYIQFYKKNHNLSDERKEKIKMQIQRARNNLRDVFALDYEVWMKYEVNGSVRLNKIARDILAMYCPFSADIERTLMSQPLFEEGFARSNRERGKKTHELELRYKALEAKGVEIPEQLRRTLAFYRDM